MLELIRQLARRCAGGDDQTVVVQLRTIAKCDHSVDGGQRHSRHAQTLLQLQLVEFLGTHERYPVGLPLAREHFLRQGRTVIWNMRLRTNKGDGALKSLGAQTTAHANPGE